MCNLAQAPDRVYSLYSVIGDNYGRLTAAEHYLHGAVRQILHTRAFKQAWKNTHIRTQYTLTHKKITYPVRLERQREGKYVSYL